MALVSANVPTLVVVSGPAGSGKTTLAHRLAPAVACPAIIRDEIKEGMAHTARNYKPEVADDLALRASSAFFEALRFLIERGVTVVAEAAFQDHVWTPNLVPLALLAEIRVIQCRSRHRGRPDRRTRCNPASAPGPSAPGRAAAG
jgi:predicted kinase